MAAPQNTISTLPHEVLGEVFTEYASVFPDAPIVLGAVSRLFRHVAYTTPSAWSHLKLCNTDGNRKATLWLQLSKAYHVDVQIDLARVGRPEHGIDATTKKVSSAVEALRFHTDRIASLCIRTDTPAQAHAALAAIYSDIRPTSPALRSLRISAVTLATSGPSLAFSAIPGIIDLETTNIPLAALPSLNLGSLQSLRVVQPIRSAPVAAEDIFELTRVAPQLRRLQVEGRIADPTGTMGPEPCFLPQLAKLHLRANNIVALLDQLIVPALHELHLSDLDGKRENASADMGSALHRLLVRMELGKGDVKSNQLRVLELAGVDVERGDAMWQRCMQRMKKLVVFSVDSPAEEEVPMQREMAKVDISPQEPRTRPVEAAFAFGFGF